MPRSTGLADLFAVGVRARQQRLHAQRPGIDRLIELAYEEQRDGLVVSVRGELDLETSPQLDRYLRRLERRGQPILLDLTWTTFVDVSALRWLLAAANRARFNRTELYICRPIGRARRAFDMTGLGRILPLLEPDDAELPTLPAKRRC